MTDEKKKFKVSVWADIRKDPKVEIVKGDDAHSLMVKTRDLKMNKNHCEVRVEPAKSDDEKKIKHAEQEKKRVANEKNEKKNEEPKVAANPKGVKRGK